MKKKVFFDSDVLLDVLIQRPKHYEQSAVVLSLADSKVVEGYTSTLILCNLHYILRKQLGEKVAMLHVAKLLEMLEILDLRKNDISAAMNLGMPDFEDAIQSCIAFRSHMDWIVTRNSKDFKKSSVKPLIPSEFIELGYGS